MPKAKSLHVDSLASAKKIDSLMKNGCVTIAVIVADWCGACKRVKPHWLNMLKKKNKKNVVLVNNEVFPNTSLNHLNITHFPSVFEIAPGKEPVLLKNVSDPAAIESAVNGFMNAPAHMNLADEPNWKETKPKASKSIPASEFVNNVKTLNSVNSVNSVKTLNTLNTLPKVNTVRNSLVVMSPKTFRPSLEPLKGGTRRRRSSSRRRQRQTRKN